MKELEIIRKALYRQHLLKQDKLVSGKNIKTINHQSVLGKGNLSVSGEPDAYIKRASVSQDGNTLTLTKKDGSEVAFTRSSGGASVFIVVPYETTYEKVLQAYNAGNILIAKMANCYYPLQYATNSQFIFWGYGFLPGSGDDFWKWVINSDNEWSCETVSPEHYTTEYIPYGSNSIPSDREYKVSYTSISTQYGDIQFIPYHHSEETLYGRRYIFATIESGNLIKVFCEIETRAGLTNWSTTIEYIGNLISNAAAGKTASDTIATYGNIVTHNAAEFATAAQGTKADTALQRIDNEIKGNINDIKDKIPPQASTTNQLADKAFTNSSIATNTANYIFKTVGGEKVPFDSIAELEAHTGTVTNNDYAFVTGTDADGNVYFDRYKATVSGTTVTWAKEYRLNNSAFTAAQWTAIQSGATEALIAKLSALPAASKLAIAKEITTSETWTFTLSDGTTVSKTIPLI